MRSLRKSSKQPHSFPQADQDREHWPRVLPPKVSLRLFHCPSAYMFISLQRDQSAVIRGEFFLGDEMLNLFI